VRAAAVQSSGTPGYPCLPRASGSPPVGGVRRPRKAESAATDHFWGDEASAKRPSRWRSVEGVVHLREYESQSAVDRRTASLQVAVLRGQSVKLL